MAVLEIKLLGSFRVSKAGASVNDFQSNKARALLAYLVVESRKQHHRCVLASMLWPDLPEHAALSNLRNTISFLRKLLGDSSPDCGNLETDPPDKQPSYLIVNRDVIQFNPLSDYSLDVAQFIKSVQGDQPIEVLEKALTLVEGEFMDGFHLKNSSFFEKWIMAQREQIDQLINLTLRTVANGLEHQGSYEKALLYARRQLEYMPWSEVTNRQIIRLYGLTGNLKQAIIQYETCKHILWEELGVEPEPETIALFEQVRDGKIKADNEQRTQNKPVRESASLRSTDYIPPSIEDPIPVIGRSQELQKLSQHLEIANRAYGRMVFVSGEVGSGKTVLMKEFAQQAIKENSSLIAAPVSHAGTGGTIGLYLPIRELTQLLCGDHETRKAYGTLTHEQAHRLDTFSPTSLQIFKQYAPILVSLFLSPESQLPPGGGSKPQRGRVSANSNSSASERSSAFEPSADWIFPMQAEVFEQFYRALRFLSFQQPLLILMDDLQWADAITVSLLEYLGKRLAGSRILMVGAFRSDEIAASGNGERQGLRSLINELRMNYMGLTIDLEQSNGRKFLDALCDTMPSSTGLSLGEPLERLTNGNPLLTIELMENLKERGIIVEDGNGLWSQRNELCWESLPERVEAMIDERLSRLPENYQKMLMAASVQNDAFIPAVVAAILGFDENEVEQAMSGPLSTVYHLVTCADLDWFGNRWVIKYRFTKSIFQVYLYNHLDGVQRKLYQAATTRFIQEFCGEESKALPLVTKKLAHSLQHSGR